MGAVLRLPALEHTPRRSPKKLKARNRRGGGCVYARYRDKDKKVLRGWWLKFYQNGEQIIRNAHTTDKQEAERQLAEALGKKAEGATFVRRVLTFGTAVEHLRTIQEAKGKPFNYAFDMHLLPFFKAGTSMPLIDAQTIWRYIRQRQQADASNATINRELAALSRLFSQAIEDGLLRQKPNVPRLPENNTRVGFFEREEYDRLLEALRVIPRLRDLVIVLYETGWRKGEIIGKRSKDQWVRSPLRWRHVDFDRREIRLDPHTTKKNDGRIGAFTEDLEAALKRRWEARNERLRKQGLDPATVQAGDELVFTKKNGQPLGSFRKWWLRALREAKIPDRVVPLKDGTTRTQTPIPHDFRRTAVKRLTDAGVPDRVSMQLTGHKTRSVFDRYRIVSPADLHEAARRLDAAKAAGTHGSSRNSSQEADRTASTTDNSQKS
jgi:integrase